MDANFAKSRKKRKTPAATAAQPLLHFSKSLNAFKLPELKELCRLRGIAISGAKGLLITRLLLYRLRHNDPTLTRFEYVLSFECYF